tara:strand:+ start:562 stop:1017 length:456 start_codon:yes stop_codon:yes gene_type:complete
MNIGDKLKEINFLLDNGEILKKKDLLGEKLIVYFYPKDDTPGCTKEAIEFSQLLAEFKNLRTNVIGVSKDTIEKHKKFIQKHNLKVNLASDENLVICKVFNTWVEKSMYGKKYMGIERATFLFDENLRLINIWNKVKVKNHAQEVLNFISN